MIHELTPNKSIVLPAVYIGKHFDGYILYIYMPEENDSEASQPQMVTSYLYTDSQLFFEFLQVYYYEEQYNLTDLAKRFDLLVHLYNIVDRDAAWKEECDFLSNRLALLKTTQHSSASESKSLSFTRTGLKRMRPLNNNSRNDEPPTKLNATQRGGVARERELLVLRCRGYNLSEPWNVKVCVCFAVTYAC